MSQTTYVRKRVIEGRDFWEKINPPLLARIDIELTERCNNDCLHCYINLPRDDSQAQRKELSCDEVKNILKEAASLGCRNLRFTGGEPLLRDDFSELYIFARELGFRVILFTNATLFTPLLADLFSRFPPLGGIEITLYGMKQKTYEAVSRVPGSFEAAWRGMSLLLERRIPFVVKGVFLPPNRDEIEEFDKMALNIPWMGGRPPSYCVFFDLRGRRDNELKNQVIKGLRLSGQEALKVISRKNHGFIKEMGEFCVKFMRPHGDKLFHCGAGVGMGCVDAYGCFQPCMKLRHPDCRYDLRRGSLADALINFFPKIRRMKAKDSEYLDKCARCFLKGFCEQCPAASWMEHGTLDGVVEYFCAAAHSQAEILGLLKKGERAWKLTDWPVRLKELKEV